MKKKSPTFVTSEDKTFALNRAAKRRARRYGIPCVSVPMPCLRGPSILLPKGQYVLCTAEGAQIPYTPYYEAKS